MRTRLGRLLLPLVGAATLAVTIAPAMAANYALLVGVTDYPDEIDVLDGPINDVEILARALNRRGFGAEDVRVLVDRPLPDDLLLEVLGRPTRARIMAELQRLAEITAPGDFVYIHLSGHGSQQPQPLDVSPADTEADFLDEIFLPVDIGSWSDPDSTVENAILDDELGDLVRRMRDNGAFVWLVVDACHSGTMTRSLQSRVPADAQVRQVEPWTLGIPPELMARAFERSRSNRTRSLTPPVPEVPMEVGGSAAADAPAEGGLVAFFAAQDEEFALELPLPQSYSAPDRRRLSLLTYHMVGALTAQPDATYREIALAIQAGYDSYWGPLPTPTPQFEGDLDRRLFLGAPVETPRWVATRRPDGRLILSAGRLDGLVEGARLDLHGVGTDAGDPVAQAEAVAVGVSETVLDFPEGAPEDLPGRLYGVLVEQPPAEPITMALPPGGAGGPLAEALDRLQRDLGVEGLAVRVVPPGEPADITLQVGDGRASLVAAGVAADGEIPPFVPTVDLNQSGQTIAEQLLAGLAEIARGRNLLAVAAEHGGGPLAASLPIETLVFRDPGAALADNPDRHTCEPPPQAEIPPEAASANGTQIPVLYQCDTLYLRIRNDGDRPIDTTLLYIGADGAFDPLPTFENGLRIEPGGATVLVPVQVAVWNYYTGEPLAAGLERIVVIGVERGEGADLSFIANFAHLTDPLRPVTRSLAANRDPAASALTGLVEGLTFPGRRTRTMGDEPVLLEQIVTRVIRWRTARVGPEVAE